MNLTLAINISPPAAVKSARCYACGEDLPVEEFARDGTKASGYKGFCKACDNAKSRRHYEANRERKLASMAKRRTALREARGHRRRRERWKAA